jgi:YARHG domain-containing protein
MKFLYSILFSILIISPIDLCGNIAVYGMKGNHLVPKEECDIEVASEILRIQLVGNDTFAIYADYELYNPGEEKTIMVGFDLAPRANDGFMLHDRTAFESIYEFEVAANQQLLEYNRQKVYDSSSFFIVDWELRRDSAFPGIQQYSLPKEKWWKSYWYNHVYFYEVTFKPGINKIRNCYKCSIGLLNLDMYDIDYILTSANKWANNQIDDFTLIIDLGEYQGFMVRKENFKDENWIYDCKTKDTTLWRYKKHKRDSIDFKCFYTLEIPIIYKQKNFHPTDELKIEAITSDFFFGFFDFNFLDYELFYNDMNYYPYYSGICSFDDEISYEILKNHPYARRGMIFSNPEIQHYFECRDWYQPNPEYQPNYESLSSTEKGWLFHIEEVWQDQQLD